MSTNANSAAKSDDATHMDNPTANMHHMIIRKALVDWGDYILDALMRKYANHKKIVDAIEETRRDIVDPLR